MGSVVRTTTKVVEETVEVTVVEKESQNATQEPETAETASGPKFRRTIPVEASTPALESLEPSMQVTKDIEATPKSVEATPKLKADSKRGDVKSTNKRLNLS